jgi:ClpX C4-type zinc finger
MEEGNDRPRGDAHLYTLSDEEAFLQAADEKPAIIAEPPPDPAWFKCWFCRKSHPQVQQLYGADYAVRDPNTFAIITLVFICDECVARFAESLAQESPKAPGMT